MADDLSVKCCIAGGGPAGMMAGYLLARAGVDVVVLEKHADFLRDFRGDTIHPSTLEVMNELGLYDALLKRPHQQVTQLKGRFGTYETVFADFSHLPTRAKFMTLMPQWDFLDFLAGEARRYPKFKLMMNTEAVDLRWQDERVVGVVARGPEGEFNIASTLVLGCDGRRSTVREKAGLKVEDIGAPMDVLWFALTRLPDDPIDPVGNFGAGRIFVMIYRGDYWQCGYVIAKGGLEDVRRRGLQAFRDDIEALAPFLHGRSAEVTSFDDLKLLSVGVDRLTVWHRPGVLCIGDAAHTMSPVGGIGINLAIQDAVATANLLAGPLRDGTLTDADLQRLEDRRESPTRRTQSLQVAIQNNVIKAALGRRGQPVKPPFLLRLIGWVPYLTRIPARIVGLGFLPEHVDKAVIP
ncbi:MULTISPECIES: FAD-dependent oxidoreductase [Rhodomicrobium]|uniref:FAD-dependent oxidoreductase n=1 Tax=Rhodomicrobium TaxID=1068 RepID=UPI000B4B925A|nr:MULTISPECIES: FAD-dependent oxidoreductase [Rhodomicrobium]